MPPSTQKLKKKKFESHSSEFRVFIIFFPVFRYLLKRLSLFSVHFFFVSFHFSICFGFFFMCTSAVGLFFMCDAFLLNVLSVSHILSSLKAFWLVNVGTLTRARKKNGKQKPMPNNNIKGKPKNQNEPSWLMFYGLE